MNTYLVAGLPRSGTSTVARILHEKLNVHMGSDFIVPDEANPGGYYEDEAFIRLNKFLLRDKMSFPVWAEEIQRKIDIRNHRGISWGFKDPDLWCLLGFYIGIIPNLRIIVCVRDMELVVKSFIRLWGDQAWPEEQVKEMWVERNAVIGNTLNGNPNVVAIAYNEERKTDDEIIKQLAEKWGNNDSSNDTSKGW